MSRASEHRVRILCDLSRDMQSLGPMYLALLLVSEAAARETLEALIFGEGDLDGAVAAADVRLRRMMVQSSTPTERRAAARAERSRRHIAGITDLGARAALRAEGKPLPDARRRAKETA